MASKQHTRRRPAQTPHHREGHCSGSIWEPIPHGTQKIGVLNMLKAWKWKARPLQPNLMFKGWAGAAEDPPNLIMPTDVGDIVISLQKSHGESDHSFSLTSSAKT